MLHISRLRAVLQESQDPTSDGIGQSAITRFVSFNQCRVSHFGTSLHGEEHKN